MKTILRIVKIILLIVGLETGYAEAAEKVKKRGVYMRTNVRTRKTRH